MTKKNQGPGEFEIIARYLAPLAEGCPGALGLLDDAAVLDVPTDRQVIATVDAAVAGVHFLPEDPPGLVARKLLRVNLSDLAAMGAVPFVYLLVLALTNENGADWLEAFAAGLAADQAKYGISLAGGDTVKTPGPSTVTLTALGTVETGGALRRTGARPGDAIYVSGSIGDAALGLAVLKGELDVPGEAHRATLASRYRLPEPRLDLGRRLRGLAHAVIDVSDGLVADLTHVCEVSGVGAGVEASAVPFSDAARAVLDAEPDRLTDVLTGGDDYELLFTVPEGSDVRIAALVGDLSLPITRIGHIVEGTGVIVRDRAGHAMRFDRAGYTHF